MTVKELEERTGLARANIRFYEEEGLLFPHRLPNGYRDYTEEDVLTLEKIKLLRQLNLDINTIRLIQRGHLSLERALFSQRSKLEGDRALIDRALDVCMRLERSRVEYAALEPRAWLQELEAPSRPTLAQPEPQPKPEPTELEKHYWSHRACEHPWMRLFARSFDVVVYQLLFLFLFVCVFRWYGYLHLGWFADVLFSIGIYCVSILVEPFWLHYVGWTPGKWIFGLKIRDKNGEKLSLSQARTRAWRVAWEGDGLYIPLYIFWRNWKSYKCYRNNEDCPWDAERGYLYTREERKLYGLWWAGGVAVYLFLSVLMALQILMPLHRGPMTVEEFSENYNDIIEKNQMEYTCLDSQGKWVVEPVGDSYHVVVIDPFEGDTVWHDPDFTVEDGHVTAVTFRMESDDEWLSVNDSRPLLGMMALSGSGEGQNLFNYNYNGWVKAWERNAPQSWEDYSFAHRGIRVTQTIEAYGYEGFGVYSGSHLIAMEGQEHFVTRTVTISLVGSEK